ncbi:MAG: DUF4065 domain-containing protein [Clostridiales bacterium]|nr:DUF4065 domain-containing protein [Clostridiales bacterium]
MVKKRMDFCIQCRKDTEYILRKKIVKKVIREKEYSFTITVAMCTECGEEMHIPGLIDKNTQEIDEQYRLKEGIVSIEDIKKLLELYKIGKAPLSLALGFGEVTITRYLEGQIPSKEYSDIIRLALTSPAYMRELLKENRDRITDSAYHKSTVAVHSLESLFSVSDKMLWVISYIFEEIEEVTPLMLQKLLYFIQGIYYALYDEPMFEEDCEAWIHGPVYPEVYRLFKNFKYNPIDDVRFVILKGQKNELSNEERKVIDLVINTFGLYSGKVLERITHKEKPWKDARMSCDDDIPSKELLPKDSIYEYYKSVNEQYDISSENGLRQYIRDMTELSL